MFICCTSDEFSTFLLGDLFFMDIYLELIGKGFTILSCLTCSISQTEAFPNLFIARICIWLKSCLLNDCAVSVWWHSKNMCSFFQYFSTTVLLKNTVSALDVWLQSPVFLSWLCPRLMILRSNMVTQSSPNRWRSILIAAPFSLLKGI